MKELTIEEKAKRFDEAIKKAKSKIKNDKDHILYEDDIIELFPELRESEEERIRQFLIHEVTETSDEIMSYRNMNKKDVLAWLEKQGKCHISHDDEIMIEQFTEYFTTGHGLQNTNETIVEWLNNVKEKLEKQGEQKRFCYS